MQSLKLSEVVSVIESKLDQQKSGVDICQEGKVVSLADGVAILHGLEGAVYGELVEFSSGGHGIVMNLQLDTVGVVALEGTENLKGGDTAKSTGRACAVPVGEALLGRVVDALGKPIDNLGRIETSHVLPLERISPGVITRQSVHVPLQTGIKAVDVMIPIGRGQRELIIGDRQTGKTSIAIEAILNQKGKDVKCIYVAIGQKQSTVANVVHILKQKGAMDYTTVVFAGAADSSAMQYLSPYAGCAMGEYYRDKGEDALIVYDDLSKHAVAYRQISLLLRRPPGREAYPGDVFYLHSRLLERAACVNAEYVEKQTQGAVKGKEGSLTALPIVETQGGDISSFVPTNVISITDGQIFLESDLFNAGLRPAINVGLSVSRVGGSAQPHLIKKMGAVRLALAQYRELAAFSQFASDLDPVARAQLEKGSRITELMKQGLHSPMSAAEMAVVLFLGESTYLSRIPVDQIASFEAMLITDLQTHHQSLLDRVNKELKHSKELMAEFDAIVKPLVDRQYPDSVSAGEPTNLS